LRSGDPSPVPGRTIVSVRPDEPYDHGHDFNDLGGYAAVVLLSGSAASDTLLVKNSLELAQEGDVLPALAPQALLGLEQASVRISDSGQVYWLARTDGPVGNDVALMRDRDVLLRVGETQVQGELVTAIDGNSFEITPDGRYLLVRVGLSTDRALLRVDLGAAVPIPGCVPNPGTLRHTAGLVLTDHTFRLTLDGPARPGSVVRVLTSLGEATPGNPCGIPTPFGELLIDPTRRLAPLNGGLFANAPVHIDVGLPADPALVDLEVFAQGAFVTPGRLLRTNGMRLVIGAD
jgi:hypothetical protein